MSTRDSRMETLNNIGVDTSRYFNVNDTSEVNVIDEIATQIIEDGYVKNTKLHRRWVMAQMFRMINWKNRWRTGEEGYAAYLKIFYGYNYQFTMMLEEVCVLSKLEDRDRESFLERSKFFSKDVVADVCATYISNLQSYISRRRRNKKCKGRPYVKIRKQYIFTDNLEKKVYNGLIVRVNKIKKAKNYKEIYKVLTEFVGLMHKLPHNFEKISLWIDAFQNNGAYYTLKNLVMYHNCSINVESESFSGIEGVNYLQSTLEQYKTGTVDYMDMLEKCIEYNNFDFNARMAEIRN